MKSVNPGEKKTLFVFIIIALEIVFALLTFINFYSHDLSIYYDTDTFVQASQHNFYSVDFFLDWRLPFIPLLYKILNCDFIAIGYLQTILYILSWLFLSWTLTKIIQSNWLKITSVFGVLFIGLVPEFQIWNNILLSESISISLLVIFVAFLILHNAIKKKGYALGIVGIAAIFSFTRDTNSYIVLMLALFYLVFFFVQRPRNYQYLFLTTFFSMFFLFTNFTSEMLKNVRSDDGTPILKRYQIPLFNIYHFKVLTNNDTIEIFKKYGMPVSPNLQSIQKHRNWYVLLFREKEFKDFVFWVLNYGKNSYAKFLIFHPLYTINELLINQEKIFLLANKSSIFKYASMPKVTSSSRFTINSQFPNRFFHQAKNRKELLQLLRSKGIGHTFIPFKFILFGLGGLLFITMAMACVFRFSWTRRDGLLYFAMFIFAFPHILLCFHGDAIEIERHCVGSLAHLLIAIFLLIIFLMGNLFDKKKK